MRSGKALVKDAPSAQGRRLLVHHQHLHSVREHELRAVVSMFRKVVAGGAGCRVLEIGAGTGYQAARLSEMGYRVTAIDLASSYYEESRVFSVLDYDGRTLPFPDASFDIVFSSNVLEHIEDVDGMLAEIRRVLVPHGGAVHVLPSTSWRFWTTAMHFPWVVTRIVRRCRQTPGIASSDAQLATSPRAWKSLFPSRHGERGNVLSEMLYFSSYWWRFRFTANGFRVTHSDGVGIFYTGCMVAGGAWSIASRCRWSKWLGSACRIYVLEPHGYHGRVG